MKTTRQYQARGGKKVEFLLTVIKLKFRSKGKLLILEDVAIIIEQVICLPVATTAYCHHPPIHDIAMITSFGWEVLRGSMTCSHLVQYLPDPVVAMLSMLDLYSERYLPFP